MPSLTTWKPASAQRTWEMLNIVPPACQTSFGFLVGEPESHRTCRITGRAWQPTFAAFAETDTLGSYEATEALTVAEFRALSVRDVLDARVREAA
ncbi:hypothetical protein ACLBYG_22055 [Methylobacterium sp. D53M]